MGALYFSFLAWLVSYARIKPPLFRDHLLSVEWREKGIFEARCFSARPVNFETDVNFKRDVISKQSVNFKRDIISK